MSDRNGWLIWVCVCCTHSHANGECCPDDTHGGDSVAPWSAVDFTTHDVTMGIGAEDHDSDCIVYVLHDLSERFPDMEWPNVPGDYECECSRNTFSRSQCDGCGSWLHGEREGFYLWERETADTTTKTES